MSNVESDWWVYSIVAILALCFMLAVSAAFQRHYRIQEEILSEDGIATGEVEGNPIGESPLETNPMDSIVLIREKRIFWTKRVTEFYFAVIILSVLVYYASRLIPSPFWLAFLLTAVSLIGGLFLYLTRTRQT